MNQSTIEKFKVISNQLYQTFKNIDNGMRCKHIACILQNGIPCISFRMNFHLTMNQKSTTFSIHAEVNAIIELLKKENLYVRKTLSSFRHIDKKLRELKEYKKIIRKCSKLDLFVIRLKSDDGILLNSEPCENCSNIISSLGFKNVIFSTGSTENPFSVVRA